MKNKFTLVTLILAALTLCTASMVKNSTGIAGYAGSPGEQTCGASGCHGGGSSTAKSITITSTPSFSLNQYYPDSVYTVSVTVNATGFSRFGFGCEVLNGSNVNSGTLQGPGGGVQIINSAKKTAAHTTPKSGTNAATFVFKWVAPPAGDGDAVFYVCGNAVNFNGNTLGDLPIPYSYTLTEGAPPTPTVDTGVRENNNNSLSNLTVFPNPTNGLSTLSYKLNTTMPVNIELIEISGKKVKDLSAKTQFPGSHSEIIDLHDVAKGVYFVRTSTGGVKLSQKLLVVN